MQDGDVHFLFKARTLRHSAAALLKPLPALSIVVTFTVVPLNVSLPHVPQLAELNPAMASATLMNGNVDSEPKVVKFRVSRSFEPLLHSTVAKDWLKLS